MKKFFITVGALTYEGLFACSFDAAIDAMEKFPEATRISVRGATCLG